MAVMRISKNTYNRNATDLLVCLLLSIIVMFLMSCGSATEKGRDIPKPTGAIAVAESDFDPLKDTRDRTIITSEMVANEDADDDTITDSDELNWAQVDSFLQAQNLEDSSLTIYRVQLFASQYFTETNYEHQIAQEVFSDSVFIKYDLPYYKVLLGNTTSKDRGRRLLYNARSLGYYNSWLIETAPDSIYYRILYVKDSVATADSLRQLREQEFLTEPE